MQNKNKQDAWYRCPVALDLSKNLSIYAKAVYHNFLAHRNNKTGDCFPSVYVQSKEIGCNKESVCKGRKELLKEGWISKTYVISKKTKRPRVQWIIVSEPRFPNIGIPASEIPVIGKLTNKKYNKEEITNKEEIKQEISNFCSSFENYVPNPLGTTFTMDSEQSYQPIPETTTEITTDNIKNGYSSFLAIGAILKNKKEPQGVY